MAVALSKPKDDKPYCTLGDGTIHTDKHMWLLILYFEDLERKLENGKIIQEQINKRAGDSRGKHRIELMVGVQELHLDLEILLQIS